MNKFLIAIFASVVLLFSCKGNSTGGGGTSVPSDSDSILDTVAVDTMEKLIAEVPMPKAADELFDDFIFNFAGNRKLQMKRIKFPLRVELTDKVDTISRKAWKTEHFFMRQGYYTLIFDNRKQMEAVKDTSINHVVVEKIYFKTKTVKQYIFEREYGLWMMTCIRYIPMYQNINASFMKFYQQFACDSVFQSEHLSDIVQFTGPDPDDDFSQMDGLLTPETWPAFAPQLPDDMIYNILYGQIYSGSNQKIFVIRGISNGLEMELTFKRKGGKWLLVKLSE